MTKKRAGKTEFVKWFGPILDALRALGGSAKPREIYEWIGETLNIPDEILNERYEKSGSLKFPNQIAWARQYLVWEKLLDSSKHGVWALTSKGWETQINEDQAHEIFLKWVKVFQELREEKNTDNVDKEAEKIIQIQEESEPETSKNTLKPTLLEVLQNLSPTGFEFLCGRLLREYNFENIEITQRSHDGGIDGYATLKLNPFVNLSVFFQCKRYQGTVPTEKVQAFIGVMETNKRSVEKGLLITTGSFAKAALEIEKSNIKLELIDGERLVEMFEEVELGVTPKTIYEPDMTFFEQYRDKK
ncbi:MAG TPA: restriction endonuclease [Tenuifilaceae bacterium]|nr:restriction endonuclease [Tenuifilaceae bacterium]HPI44632.1 restriction endonuclease [Tenuifilaceae bacterium]HPN21987.1 restriction endonuclease [Tenuifilaceae bacterium]HSA04035.1 restriction endonuclease [Tenuifilaceae bacterium]